MRRYGAVMLLILFAALLYSPFLLRTIRYDEAYTLHYFAYSPIIALFDWAAPNNHKLYSLLVWFARLGLPDLFALRSPAFLAALVSIALLYRLAGRRTGLFAAALLATNPVFADYAVNGRGYTLMIALTLVFILVTRRRALFWCTIALVLTLPSCVILCLARPRLPVFMGLWVGGLFYVPALLWGELRGASQFGATLPELWNEWLPVFSGTGLVLLCALGGWSLWYGWRRLRAWRLSSSIS